MQCMWIILKPLRTPVSLESLSSSELGPGAKPWGATALERMRPPKGRGGAALQSAASGLRRGRSSLRGGSPLPSRETEAPGAASLQWPRPAERRPGRRHFTLGVQVWSPAWGSARGILWASKARTRKRKRKKKSRLYFMTQILLVFPETCWWALQVTQIRYGSHSVLEAGEDFSLIFSVIYAAGPWSDWEDEGRGVGDLNWGETRSVGLWLDYQNCNGIPLEHSELCVAAGV